MQYLKSFSLASERDETDYCFGGATRLDMACYDSNNAYPFHIFPKKNLQRLDFAPITLLYGGNGSGKSTLLNVIAEKLSLHRTAPFNTAPAFPDYLDYCRYELCTGVRSLPRESEIVTSDGVFDFLLDFRAINQGLDNERERLFQEYDNTREDCRSNGYYIKSLDDYDELKRRNDARKLTKSQYTARRMNSVNMPAKSNGESAYIYFTQRIKENALFLLDEPENSLSARLQCELAEFLESSVRFFGCQLIISTHSPFLLSMKGAKIYDLDAFPARERNWTELENVRAYHDFFEKKRKEFER